MRRGQRPGGEDLGGRLVAFDQRHLRADRVEVASVPLVRAVRHACECDVDAFARPRRFVGEGEHPCHPEPQCRREARVRRDQLAQPRQQRPRKAQAFAPVSRHHVQLHRAHADEQHVFRTMPARHLERQHERAERRRVVAEIGAQVRKVVEHAQLPAKARWRQALERGGQVLDRVLGASLGSRAVGGEDEPFNPFFRRHPPEQRLDLPQQVEGPVGIACTQRASCELCPRGRQSAFVVDDGEDADGDVQPSLGFGFPAGSAQMPGKRGLGPCPRPLRTRRIAVAVDLRRAFARRRGIRQPEFPGFHGDPMEVILVGIRIVRCRHVVGGV